MSAETELRGAGLKDGYEPCEECGAPLDAQQRYCVECAARRGNGANPSSRYFATMSKRARRPLTAPPGKRAPTSRAAAVGFFALLPIAVALGVVVGRSGSSGSDNDALIRALQQREAQTAEAGPVTGTETASTKQPTAKKAGKNEEKKSKAEKKLESEGGKVVAQTKNGTVHQVTGYKAPPKKVEEDTKLVEENPEQTGENYIKAQQNLPDVVVVGGEGGGSEESSTPGVEP
jgi:hypothetical protein